MIITTFEEAETCIKDLQHKVLQLETKVKSMEYIPQKVTSYANKAKDDYHKFTEKMEATIRKLIYWVVGSVFISLVVGSTFVYFEFRNLNDRIHGLDKKIIKFEGVRK